MRGIQVPGNQIAIVATGERGQLQVDGRWVNNTDLLALLGARGEFSPATEYFLVACQAAVPPPGGGPSVRDALLAAGHAVTATTDLVWTDDSGTVIAAPLVVSADGVARPGTPARFVQRPADGSPDTDLPSQAPSDMYTRTWRHWATGTRPSPSVYQT